MSAERPLRLHHHAFVVKDQLATRRFYEEVVGLPLVATWCEEEATTDGRLTFCHTFFELADGGCLAFFQFADEDDAKRYAHQAPPSVYHHIALLATKELQHDVEKRANAAGTETHTIDHGYCTSLYLRDPDGLLVELTVDAPGVEESAGRRRESARRDLDRWLAGDHSPNNEFRPDS